MSTYLLNLPKESFTTALKALHVRGYFQKGDFRHILGVRQKDIKGEPVDGKVVKDILFPAVKDLSMCLFSIHGPNKDALDASSSLKNLRDSILQNGPGKDISLSQDSCVELQKAAECLCRLHLGQLEYSLENLVGTRYYWESHLSRDIREIERLYKKILFGIESPGMYLGVGHRAASVHAGRAYTLLQVVRHRLSWDRNPEGGMTVNFDKPMQIGDSSPMPLIQRVS